MYTITAYDLSVESCGKSPEHPSYGVTASGKNLSGQTWETARAISVDPNVIPLGTKVYIAFCDEKMSKYNGIYTAVDTGGAINGQKIDFFYGDYGDETPDEIWEFGRQKAEVFILI